MRPLLLLLAVVALAAEDALPGTRLLTSGRLEVQIMDPASPERYNRGVRFTPVAAVLRARFAGHDYLFSPAAHDPVGDHGGLAAEFDLCIPGGPAGDLPPGWSGAPVGGPFLKVGVGMLTKSREPYHLFQQPAVQVPAATEAAWEPAAARFHQTCPGAGGYAYELWADVALGGDRIDIDWRLANTGTKPFATRQYSHNFVRFDDADVGPDYRLSFPYPIAPTGLEAEQEALPDAIRFVRPIPRWVNLVVPWPGAWTGANELTVAHESSGRSLTCSVSLPGLRTAVHARRGYCAPEQFVLLRLEPGGEARWRRSYRFGG